MRQVIGLVGTSFSLIALYLLLVNATGAKQVIGAITDFYTSAVRVLQGRG